MGKWQSLKETYPKLPRAAELDAEREKHANLNDTDLINFYDYQKHSKELLEKELRAVNLSLDALTSILVDRWEDKGLQTVKLADGSSVGLLDEPYPQVTDKEKLNAWCEANGLKESLNLQWQTLKSVVKNRLENGEVLPPGVEIYMKTSISRRGVKK